MRPDGFQKGDWVVVTLDDGRETIRRVKYPPWQLGDGSWVIGLDGISGGYALERVRKDPEWIMRMTGPGPGRE